MPTVSMGNAVHLTAVPQGLGQGQGGVDLSFLGLSASGVVSAGTRNGDVSQAHVTSGDVVHLTLCCHGCDHH